MTIRKEILPSDPTSSIRAITKHGIPGSKTIKKCKNYLNILRTRSVETVLQWIQPRCEIFGYEKADEPAKKGTYILQSSQPEIPLGSAARLIKKSSMIDRSMIVQGIQGIHGIPGWAQIHCGHKFHATHRARIV